MSKIENIQITERGHKKFLNSVKRQGKERNINYDSDIFNHSKNIKHLVSIKDVFSTENFFDSKENRFKIPEIDMHGILVN